MKTITKHIYSAALVISLALGLVTADGDIFVTIDNGGGNGDGFVYRYTPDGVQTVFASGLSKPRGVAMDQSGNLFVTNTTFDGQLNQASVIKITPGGVQSNFATFTGNVRGEGVVFDGAGNLFVAVIDEDAPPYPATIYKFTPSGVQSTFGSVDGWVVGDVLFDSGGNLLVGDAWNAYIYKFAPDGSKSVFADPSAFPPDQYPAGLAFDRFGNLFATTEAATPAGDDVILKFSPSGVESTFATNLDWPNSLAFDRSGNLLVVEIGEFAPPGDVLTFTPDGNSTIFAQDLNYPVFLAYQVLPSARPRPAPPPRPR